MPSRRWAEGGALSVKVVAEPWGEGFRRHRDYRP